MKAKDLRERSLEDLKELDKSLTADTFQNRFKNFTNRLDDTSQMRKTRRDVARVKTLIKQLSVGAGVERRVVKAVKPPTAKKVAPKAAASAPASKPAKADKGAEKAAKKPSTKTKAAAKSEGKQ